MVDKILSCGSTRDPPSNEACALTSVEQALESALVFLGACPESYTDLDAALKCALTIARRRSTEQRALNVIRRVQQQIAPVVTASEVVFAAYMAFRQVRQ